MRFQYAKALVGASIGKNASRRFQYAKTLVGAFNMQKN